MAIFLKDGKILVASGGRGLSKDCDCCDRPPPPPPPPPQGCEVCCPGEYEIGDSVLISIECTLPEIAYQAFSPQPTDNGIRIIPAVEISSTGTLFVTAVDKTQGAFERVGIICLGADRTTAYAYTNKTYYESVSLEIGLAHPLDENGNWSPLSTPRCEANVPYVLFAFFIKDWLPTGGSNAVVSIATDPDTSAISYGHVIYTEPLVIFDGQSPCSGIEMQFPLLYAANPNVQVVSQPASGTEVGVLTILDVE